MNAPLYLILVKIGVPAAVAGAIVTVLSVMLAGCAGESYTLTRAPNTMTVPTTQSVTVARPSPPVVEVVPQK